MVSKAQVPYGSWKSPITVDSLAKEVRAFEELAIDITLGRVYHAERQPADARLVIKDTKLNKEVTDKANNARALIDGYGGGPVAIRDGTAYFANIPDMRIYRTTSEGCTSLSPVYPQWRFGDLIIHPSLDFLVCVREDHTDPSPPAVQTTLVAVGIQSSEVQVLAQGWDFYSSPTFSPNGKKIAYTRRNRPDSAFHSLQIVVADVIESSGSISLSNEVIVAGEPGATVAQQPQWLSNEELLFLFDVSGWGQPWCYTVGKESRPLLSEPIEEDFAEPQWFHGTSSYAVLNSTTAIYSVLRNGFARMYLLDILSGNLSEIPGPYMVVRQVRRTNDTSVVFIGSTADQGESIVELSIQLPSTTSSEMTFAFETLAFSDEIGFDRGFVSRPQDLRLTDGSGRVLHAHYYPPVSPNYEGLPGELPPAVISYHSGPNIRPPPGFMWNRLVFTSRGWAWVDIMFGGTTGFGKEYQERLDGHWGVLDVDDTVTGTQKIAELGLIDIKRVVLRGGTSGGYGVLQACIKYPDLFAAGVSLCGLADLERLQKTVLKFQLHYIDRLVGGTPAEIPDVYKARSPLFHAANIKTPLLLVHGKLDPQVPVEQTEIIAEAIRKAGGRADLIIFEDEAHGFRRAKNVKIAYQAELDLYEEIFGFASEAGM